VDEATDARIPEERRFRTLPAQGKVAKTEDGFARASDDELAKSRPAFSQDHLE
jgi:hypothetical protein